MTATAVDDKSLEHRLALLDPSIRDDVLQGVDPTELVYDWRYSGRPSQLAVTDDVTHRTLLMNAGRGAGKTRTGAEFIRDRITRRVRAGLPPLRFGLGARTAADVRDVMVQGDSGIMSVFPPSDRPRYVPSARRIEFGDGSMALCFSAEEPDQIRGPQFHYFWADELATWRDVPDDSGLTAWDNVMIATRLGDNPQVLATTTPKRTARIRSLLADAALGKVGLYTSTTFDNIHLSSAYLETIVGLYGGTRLGAQELHAQMLDDVEGALWVLADLNADRTPISVTFGLPPLRVVGVDPSVADKPKDECGIVVVGSTDTATITARRGWVLEDASLLGPPSAWAQRCVEMARKWNAPIVAEANQGGALVREVIHGVDSSIRVRLVHAKQGKALRAEPVTLAYDQHRISHVGTFPELEDQMTTWVPGETAESPDRIDAMVHGFTALVVPSAYKSGVGTTTVTRARKPIPTGARAVLGRHAV